MSAIDGGQLDPAFISVLYSRDGESDYTLRVEGHDAVVGGVVRYHPILHEKPIFNAIQEYLIIIKKNATQYWPRIKKGSRFRFEDLDEYGHPAIFYELFDQVR